MAMTRAFILFFAACAAAAAQPYLVLHKGDSSLGWYSADGRMITRVATGKHPHEMVFSRDHKRLFITANGTMKIEEAGKGGNSITIIDVDGRRVAGTIDLGEFFRPHGIDLANGLLAVSTENPDQLLIVDPEKRSVVRRFKTGGETPHMVALSPDGKLAFVSHSRSGNVTIVDTATGAITSIASGNRPEGSVLAPDGRTLYVVNRESASVSVIDTRTRKLTGSIPTAKGPVRIAITGDGAQLVVACMHDRVIEFIDAAARKITGRVALKGSPVSMHLSPDGRFAFASAEEDDTVYIVSVAERKIVREFRTAKGYAPDPVMSLK
jgi:YVTN family beta-propeller protein